MASRTALGASFSLMTSIFLGWSLAVAVIVDRRSMTTALALSRQINPGIIFS
jgi:hypothetical protein